MNDSLNPTVGSSVGSLVIPYQYRNVSVQEIENGFIVSSYTNRNFTFHCVDLEAVKAKLAEIFVK